MHQLQPLHEPVEIKKRTPVRRGRRSLIARKAILYLLKHLEPQTLHRTLVTLAALFVILWPGYTPEVRNWAMGLLGAAGIGAAAASRGRD